MTDEIAVLWRDAENCADGMLCSLLKAKHEIRVAHEHGLLKSHEGRRNWEQKVVRSLTASVKDAKQAVTAMTDLVRAYTPDDDSRVAGSHGKDTE